MGELRDVIISTIVQHRGTDVSAGDLSDAILSALRAHFATPGAVTDEMVDELAKGFGHGKVARSLYPSWKRALSAALQKME